MITRQMTSFFSSTLWALFVSIFHFCISTNSKFSSVLPSNFVLVSKIVAILIPKMALPRLLDRLFRFPFST